MAYNKPMPKWLLARNYLENELFVATSSWYAFIPHAFDSNFQCMYHLFVNRLVKNKLGAKQQTDGYYRHEQCLLRQGVEDATCSRLDFAAHLFDVHEQFKIQIQKI